jgi:hypothetical protein
VKTLTRRLGSRGWLFSSNHMLSFSRDLSIAIMGHLAHFRCQESGMSQKIDRHQKAYVCIHVFEKTKPVLLVSRADGDWAFLCGEGHEDDASNYRVVGIGHLFDNDQSLSSLMDLAPDWEAERTAPDSPWIRSKGGSDLGGVSNTGDFLPCPVCGSLVLGEVGEYQICPVCNWEDDPFQREMPDRRGANSISMNEAKEQWRTSRKRVDE